VPTAETRMKGISNANFAMIVPSGYAKVGSRLQSSLLKE